jgi:signal transduction histidine kinase
MGEDEGPYSGWSRGQLIEGLQAAEARAAAAEQRANDLSREHEREQQHRDEDFRRFVGGSPLGLAVTTVPVGGGPWTVVINPVLAELLRAPPDVLAPMAAVPLERLAGRFYVDGRPLSEEELPMRRAVEEGISLRDLELEVPHPDGSLTLFGHSVALLDQEGRFHVSFSAFMDMTARKRAEEALADADRNKDMFLALLGHELRTPLAAMSNALHLLRRRSREDPALQRSCEMMDRQLERTLRLVDDLQDLSRIKRGRLRLERAETDLLPVVAHALEAMRPQAEKRDLTLEAALPDAPVRALADAGRIEQVCMNLLGNAIKYTDPGGRIRLSLTTQNGTALISVKDTGIGIPSELLPAAFDLYRQADEALSRSQGGLGVGLALVRGLVEMHGGTVAAISEGVDRGSEFVVHLPLLDASP